MNISTDQTNLILDSLRTEIQRCKSLGCKTRVQKLQQLIDEMEDEIAKMAKSTVENNVVEQDKRDAASISR